MILLRYADLKQRRIVASRMTLRRLIDQSQFPPPFKIGGRLIAWDEAEIEDWLEARRVGTKPKASGERAQRSNI